VNDPTQSGRRRSVGDALGGFARRVGELIGEVAGQLPEGLREALDRARSLRLAGAADQALAMLRALPEPLASHPLTRFAIGLGHIHDGLRGAKPLKALAEITDDIGESLGPAAAQLLRAAQASFDGRHEAALDDLRRAARDSARAIEGDEAEARFLVHVLAALSHQAIGNEDRTLRELQKAKARLPAEAGPYLRRLVLVRGVDHLLAAGLLDDADGWVRDALAVDAEDQDAAELLARVAASRGDRPTALAQLQRFDEDPRFDRTRLWVELTVGGDDKRLDARALALRVLQSAPEDPQLRRLWALAELQRGLANPDATLDEGIRRELVEALARAAEAAPKGGRDRQLHELAHAALRLEWFPESLRQLVLARLRADEGTAPEELRLVRARLRLAAGDGQDAAGDFVPGDPPRFRADPDIAGAWGPDPMSPVRDDDTRTALLAAQRSLAAAELCLLRGDAANAQDLLVEALVEWPALARARDQLAKLVHASTEARLEDLLGSATSLLAAVPNRVLGISLEGVQHALSQVIAARERLARPLTIAIMGEFSAGKSTFVNALLGEAVAPMGVLPTTTTINVFRRGPSGVGRVHYRDGHIETLAADEVQPFLHGLDTIEAAKIRHVEIERTGGRMGDAAVVDTPGLNALDAFHEQVARGFIEEADAVVWLFSATRSGAASEVGMLASLRAGGRRVLGVLNKVDTLDPAEQTELAEYLREQLGEVLVEVVPVRAREALEHRVGKRSGEDPFAAVERALEQRFLQRARELKRELTQRRLAEALISARTAVLGAIDALGERASKAAGADDRSRAAVPVLLARFADRLQAGLLEVDDVLVREGLSLGVLRTGKGVAKGPLDPQDAGYLAACFRDAALAALQRALVEIARDDAAASEVLDRELVSWAQGNLEGLIAAGFLARSFQERGAKIAESETAAREAFRDALIPIAAAWAARARSLVRALERARARSGRQGRSAPQAEALRLRATVLASLDALSHAVAEVPA
jgi:GTPase SAR1 family protein